ncbi:alpha-glucosidase [Clostridiales bacterium COT073_COT-073]|nr:alpha-glucosidase [Clostridiales bacterium COT073_COT-073]
MINKNSTISQIFQTPIGNDILSKLFMTLNMDQGLINKFPLSKVKLKHLSSVMGEDMVNTLVQLVNSETEKIIDTPAITPKWWKEAIFYQIYPKSFCDANGDGIGDIQGIISKLDYLKDLGIDCIWLSPIYDSPNDDNGYDIRDYKKIMAEMGDMEDFKQLLEGCHTRGMKLIMDLVVNHTSDEHEWYQRALNGEKKYQDYYIFRDQPNNWKSFFSGSAWKYEESLGKYVLHLFSPKQMDLNWENPDVRQEVAEIVRFYHEMGVDGFRLDVINLISKKAGLPDGNETIGKMMEFTGIEQYYYGPRLHEFLRELRAEAFDPYEAFAVGETPGVGIEMGRYLTHESRGELDLIFNFDHLETPGHVRFDDYQYDLNFLKEMLYRYHDRLGSGDWQALFLENHDNPRILSKVLKNSKYRNVLAKMLQGLLLTFKGTPFIFQGQELASLNLPFSSIEDIRDVESRNKYQELIESGMSKEKAFQVILAGSRDHARVMINWDDTVHPKGWIKDFTLGDGYSVQAQLEKANSSLRFFRKMAAFRKVHPELIYGDLISINRDKKDVMLFERRLYDKALTIEINLTDKPVSRSLKGRKVLVSNYRNRDRNYLKPYEFTICKG